MTEKTNNSKPENYTNPVKIPVFYSKESPVNADSWLGLTKFENSSPKTRIAVKVTTVKDIKEGTEFYLNVELDSDTVQDINVVEKERRDSRAIYIKECGQNER